MTWKRPGEIRLVIEDEARFWRISDPRRCWRPAPRRPMCDTAIGREYTYAYGAVSPGDGAWDSLILPRGDTECMQIFLDEVSGRHPGDRIVMALDGAGWHRSRSLVAPENMRLLRLPPYSPELNPVENVWDELREKFFGNVVFGAVDAPEAAASPWFGAPRGPPRDHQVDLRMALDN
jgi:hypothetical protein